MCNCFQWLSRSCCCRKRSQHTYIYLYSPNMGESSSSSSLLNRLACILFGICLGFVLILATIVIYHLNSSISKGSSKSALESRIFAIARRRQLPDYVNTDIDPCENFYNFVCDKWIRGKRIDGDEDEHGQKWSQFRHRLRDKLMTNINNNQTASNESDISSKDLTVSKLYQLCETKLPSILLDELDYYLTVLIRQEPYRSHLTLFNQFNSTNRQSLPVIFTHNPFYKTVHATSNNNNSRSFSTITRIHHRPLPPAVALFSDVTKLNQTALNNLIKFDSDYRKFLQDEKDLIKQYKKEYNQDSLIVKRILSYKNYHTCLSSLNMATNGLKSLLQLLNQFLHNRLRQFNTKLIDKQIRILETINDNHTLVEHLRRIQSEFKIIEQIVPLENQSMNHNNSSCILNLLDKLLDKRMQLKDLPLLDNIESFNSAQEYFISNDWPYLIMLYDRLLNNLSTDTLVNFVFFDYYRHLIYPYYQPHISRSSAFENIARNHSHAFIFETNYSNSTCRINDCFDILHCYHPSLINQLVEDNNQIHLDSVKANVENLLSRFRSLIEQSDHLFVEEKKALVNELDQMNIIFGHYSPTIDSIPNLDSSSYLDYVRLFSSLSYDEHLHSYAIEPIYNPLNRTLFLPYGFIYTSNNSIEYPLMKFLINILSTTIRSTPFYVECLLKSFDDSNTTTNHYSDEHVVYLLSRSRFLVEQNIVFDEYLWPFMSANSLMKRFLVSYTANNYCHSSSAQRLFLNNTYINDDVHLVFNCQQASSIKQSKCSVH